MRRQIVCVGTGGQGIILLARVICEAGRLEGVPVLSAETHGMAMRGGSVVCQVKLGEFASPMVLPGRADVLIGLDAAEAARNSHYLRDGGVAIVNTPTPTARGEVDGLGLARDSGSPRNLNIVMAGYAGGFGALGLGAESLRNAVAELSPEQNRAANLAAFEKGWEAAREDRGTAA